MQREAARLREKIFHRCGGRSRRCVRHDTEAIRRRDGAVAADAIPYLGDKRQRLQDGERIAVATLRDDECVSEIEEDCDRITHDDQRLVAR
jgi:hypothetical protein